MALEGLAAVVGKAFQKVFGSRNDRLVRAYGEVALEIGRWEDEFRRLADDEAGLGEVALDAALAQVGVEGVEDGLLLFDDHGAQGIELIAPPLKIVAVQRGGARAQTVDDGGVRFLTHGITSVAWRRSRPRPDR